MKTTHEWGFTMGSCTLVVGDVHGCARELTRLVEKAAPTRVVLVGDLFTRGPDPAGVWSLIRRHNMEAVLGNHDIMTLRRWSPRSSRLPRAALRWLRKRSHSLHGRRWSVVHAGIHPKRGARQTEPQRAIYQKRYQGRLWWKQYRGPRLVIFGHDAARGLIDRRPYALGLDTDCVRGGRPSGYLLEADRLISVPAKRAYH